MTIPYEFDDMGGPQGKANFDLREEMDTPTGEVYINQAKYAVRAYSYGNPHPDNMRIPEIYGFRVDEYGRDRISQHTGTRMVKSSTSSRSKDRDGRHPRSSID